MRRKRIYTKGIFHIYNRGVEKRDIFLTANHYRQFIKSIKHYQHFDYPYSQYKAKMEKASSPEDKTKIHKFLETKRIKTPVSIISFCLMPNHYHLTLKQLCEGGISSFMHRIGTSYTNYFNIKADRTGRLFEAPFKSKEVRSRKQLCHLVRYQHLNPKKIGYLKISELINYEWSSLKNYIKEGEEKWVVTKQVLDCFDSLEDYTKFTFEPVDEFEPVRLKSVAIDDDFGWFAQFRTLKKAEEKELRNRYLEKIGLTG